MLRTIIGLAMAITIIGCSEPGKALPKLYPVQGKIITKDGKPVTGGIVRMTTGSDMSSMGAITESGTFTINTSIEKDSQPGAPEGEHTFEITGPLGRDQQPITYRILKPAKIKVEGKENKITIEVEQVGKR